MRLLSVAYHGLRNFRNIGRADVQRREIDVELGGHALRVRKLRKTLVLDAQTDGIHLRSVPLVHQACGNHG